MWKRKKIRCLGTGLSMILTMFLLSGCAIISLDDGRLVYGGKQIEGAEDAPVFGEEFDPDAYVQSIWEEEALPTFEESANDFLTVQEAISQDFEQACEEYGILSNDKGSWVFVVEGSGTVNEVNRDSRSGFAIVEIDSHPTKLQVGPVYKGASLRDSLPFIQFNDFKNQIAFSEVSSALNRMVDTNIVAQSGIDEGTGKEATFTGAFSIKNAEEEIMIIPVILEVGR